MANPVLPPTDYDRFIESKRLAAVKSGFEVAPESISLLLFPWQSAIVRWALRLGRAGIFADCGLGKTPMQLEWARHVSAQTESPVLILAPLAVAAQTHREGVKFGIPVSVCRSQEDVTPGVNVANYEMLHHFDATRFGGVVLDESSILKNYMGKTKQEIEETFRLTRYKLCCTATPAPNDHLELGNHAQFLGVMPSNEMISRWFVNDSMKAGGYRLKGHAASDYWRWVSSWAVSLSSPADLGYEAGDFVLPALNIRQHLVDAGLPPGMQDQLFGDATLSATTMHREMRRTVTERAEKVRALVADTPGPWVLWCNTNYEADALRVVIPEAIEVRGSDTLAEKETRVERFSQGEERILISKASICGFGMNWQHCHNMAFVGLSYSYEQLYQAIRRSWRFGQKCPVNAHVVLAETEGAVLAAIVKKQEAHEEMKRAMVAAMRETQLDGAARLSLSRYETKQETHLPAWLTGGAR